MKNLLLFSILIICSFSINAQQTYTCLFTDTGTEQPYVIILNSTLTDTVHWEMVTSGCYKGSIAGGFNPNKTTVTTGAYLAIEDDIPIFETGYVSGGFIYICSMGGGNPYGGGFLFGFPFKIEVYP